MDARLTLPTPLALVATALLLLALPGTALAGGRPDLVVAAGSPQQAQVAPGSQVSLSTKIGNRGVARAGSSRVVVKLGGTVIGSKKLKAVRKRGKARLGLRATLPAGAKGTISLKVCADGTSKVRESKERNNCRVVRVTVLQASVGSSVSQGVASGSGSPSAPSGGSTHSNCDTGHPKEPKGNGKGNHAGGHNDHCSDGHGSDAGKPGKGDDKPGKGDDKPGKGDDKPGKDDKPSKDDKPGKDDKPAKDKPSKPAKDKPAKPGKSDSPSAS